MKIIDVVHFLEQYAPKALQESFDNSGLQAGDATAELTGVLISLDLTEEVLQEAIDGNCNLVVSHHPIAFHGFKTLTGKDYTERCVMTAIKKGIALYAAHTNLDNVYGGVNCHLASKLSLSDVKILAPRPESLLKLTVFVPVSHADRLRQTLFDAGAGCIGNYDSCSFNTAGQGTFRANECASPFIGTVGKLSQVDEVKIEVILPFYSQQTVLQALLENHPYEEPAYDFYPLSNLFSRAGGGITGKLPVPLSEQDFLSLLKETFGVHTVLHSALTGRMLQKVAICGGAGAFLLKNAIEAHADAFVTGEARYNDYYDVDKRLLLATIGHFESESPVKELLYSLITGRFANLTVSLSKKDENPVQYF